MIILTSECIQNVNNNIYIAFLDTDDNATASKKLDTVELSCVQKSQTKRELVGMHIKYISCP